MDDKKNARAKASRKESWFNTILVAMMVTMISSILVSASVVLLRPIQEINKQIDKKRNVLIAAGLGTQESLGVPAEVDKAFQKISPHLVDLIEGSIRISDDPGKFDLARILKDPETFKKLHPDQDVAKIGKVPRYQLVYLVQKDGQIDSIILPIYGKGLWSTMYGFLALENDLNTIKGITFYEHGETPGLGGEIENPRWTSIWKGKEIFSEDGPVKEIKFRIIKGAVSENTPDRKMTVDGISGATLTSKGVENTVRFWMGQNGYGIFIKNLSERTIVETNPLEKKSNEHLDKEVKP
jgi:Na+-transporting NADH:ubiquinone oxidoreductase subunit C